VIAAAARVRVGQIPRQRLSTSMGATAVGVALLAVGASALAGGVRLGRWPAAVMVISGSTALLGGLSCSCVLPRVVGVAEAPQSPSPEADRGRAAAAQWMREYAYLRADLRLQAAQRAVELPSASADFAEGLTDHFVELYQAHGAAVEATLRFLQDISSASASADAFSHPSRYRSLPHRIFNRLAPRGSEAYLQLLTDPRWHAEGQMADVWWSVMGHALLDAGSGWARERGTGEERIRTLNQLLSVPAPENASKGGPSAMREVFLGLAHEARLMGGVAFAERMALWLASLSGTAALPFVQKGFAWAMTAWGHENPNFAAALRTNETLERVYREHRRVVRFAGDEKS
jgi:hypothetical protein